MNLMFVRKTLLLFIFVLFTNSIAYGLAGPHIISTPYSNPVWVGGDKIAYFELVDYVQAKIEIAETYKLKLVLNIKSLSNPLYHKKISWTIPENDWMKYKISRAHLSFSPEGDEIVFSIGKDKPTYKEGEIFIAELRDNSKFQKIIDNGLNPEWSPERGMIVYQTVEKIGQKRGFFTTDDGKISVGRIDFSHPNWKEEKAIFMIKEIGAGVSLLVLLIGQKPKWSSDGNKIIFSAADKIFITDKDAKSIRQIKVPYVAVGEPALSPDMGRVVFAKYMESHYWLESNLYIADVNTGSILKEIIKPNGTCANEKAPIFDLVWSPSGESIAYIYNCGSNAIFVIKKDGTGLRLISDYKCKFGW